MIPGDKVRYKVEVGTGNHYEHRFKDVVGIILKRAKSGGWLIKSEDGSVSNRAERDIEVIP